MREINTFSRFYECLIIESSSLINEELPSVVIIKSEERKRENSSGSGAQVYRTRFLVMQRREFPNSIVVASVDERDKPESPLATLKRKVKDLTLRAEAHT
jgi:hypothetical protein